MPIAVLLLGLTPARVPELVALFLPLAAWIIASRQERWHELLAATFVTVVDRDPDADRRRAHRGLHEPAHHRRAGSWLKPRHFILYS